MFDAYAASFNIGDTFRPAHLLVGQSFGGLATSIITILSSAATIIAIFFIILGGIKIVTASGDMKKIEAARQTVFYAIIGLAVTILAFVILQVIQFLFGSTVQIT